MSYVAFSTSGKNGLVMLVELSHARGSGLRFVGFGYTREVILEQKPKAFLDKLVLIGQRRRKVFSLNMASYIEPFLLTNNISGTVERTSHSSNVWLTITSRQPDHEWTVEIELKRREQQAIIAVLSNFFD